MKDETSPIDDDEWLLRRVWHERFRTDNAPIISPTAFEPRTKGHDPDDDGISMFRASCQASPKDIFGSIDVEKRALSGIVRLSVAFLKSVGLEVRSDPRGPIKGHVVLPQLNARDYASNKSAFTWLKDALAREASKDENIVVWPEAISRPTQSPE